MSPKKWSKPTQLVQKKTVTIPISKIIPRETIPEPGKPETSKTEFGTFEERVRYFENLIKGGEIPIAPILVQRRPDGKYFLIDGHGRVSAYARLGYKNVQAVVSKNPTKLEQITN
jgi:uncharacterized ParB-like nuclease family protein